ncbi:hypothetical protein ACRRTK_009430 [Alexandromys fortis]
MLNQEENVWTLLSCTSISETICLASPRLLKPGYYVCLSFSAPPSMCCGKYQAPLRLRKPHLRYVEILYMFQQFLLSPILNFGNYCYIFQ